VSRRLHRLLGAIVLLQLIVWLVTGILFNLKHRYAEAYELIERPATTASAAGLRIAPAAATTAARHDGRVVLLHDWRGYVYAVLPRSEQAKPAPPLLVDAATGDALPALDADGAREIWMAAVATSRHRDRYGMVVASSPTETWSSRLGVVTAALELTLDTGHRATVGAFTGEVTHTGPINDFIDWSYRFHYMQYTPWKRVNIVIVAAWVSMTLLLGLSGARMLLARRFTEAS